jgi:hypothetical protein
MVRHSGVHLLFEKSQKQQPFSSITGHLVNLEGTITVKECGLYNKFGMFACPKLLEKMQTG